MTGDLKLRGLSANTCATYLYCVTVFARHHGKSPRLMGRQEMRDFLSHLIEHRKARPSTYNVYAAAFRFLYGSTLGRPEEVAWIGWMKARHAAPSILNAEEIERLLAELRSLKLQAIVTAAYGAGLRISEACKLRVEDIDSQRMVIAEKGGRKENQSDWSGQGLHER